MDWEMPAAWHPAKKGSASMRNGILISVGALLTGASLAPAQMPYGYNYPSYPAYPPAYGYYAPQTPAYGYYPAPPQNYGYQQGYAQPYYVPQRAASYPAPVAPSAPPQGTFVTAPSQRSAAQPIQTIPSAPRAAQAAPPQPAALTATTPSRPMPAAPAAAEPIRSMPAEATPSVHGPAPAANVGTDGKPGAEPSTDYAGHGRLERMLDDWGGHLGGMLGGWFEGGHEDSDHGPCLWANAEYLNWSVKSGPIGVPLVTIGNPADPVPGALGSPGTTVVSPTSLTYPQLSGMRFGLGGWFDSDHLLGGEVIGFVTETRATGVLIRSDANGNPALYVPFNDPTPGIGENASAAISNPTTTPPTVGTIAITSHTRLWGMEANVLVNAWSNSWSNLVLLGGFRYADLQEQLLFNTDRVLPPFPDPNTGLLVPSEVTTHDAFGARNQFYGFQLGAKYEARYCNFFGNVQGKVAVGDNHQSVTINGYTEQQGFFDPITGAPLNPILPGGMFAQPSNIGRFTVNHFAVLPEFQAQVGYELWSCVRIYGGWNYLYFTDVARPGNAIDRNVNFNSTLIPVPVPLVGPLVPTRLVRTSDYWAEGFNVGVEVRY